VNNQIVIPIFVASIIIAFGVGAIVGTNTINISTPDTDQDNELISSIDVKSLIRINSQDDLLEKKNNLVEYIWKADGFPSSKMPQNVETTTDSRYADLQNLDKIEKITTSMENGVNSHAYLFLPKNQNGELLIYHAGHEGDFISGKPTIQLFLNEGYSVLAFSMPLLGMNNQPIVNTEDFGPIKLESHNHLRFLESPEFSPIKYFVEPIAVSLNHVESNYGFSSYHMVGISGGGWTAVLYSAIDNRITDTYSVAGSLPFHMRSESDLGDYEQTVPELYKIANYLELYILGSYGQDRELVQIFNKYDPCCFANPKFETYESQVQTTLSNIGGGSFLIYLDDTHKEHKISTHALEIILNRIKE
jgi:pimeloyl-ACP methyl ester carboxylesterase